MSDLKLFRIGSDGVQDLEGTAVALERSLQRLIEDNLDALRSDALGIDENGCPVIIEYKRWMDENVINPGLFYLDWLLDYESEFWKLVLERLGQAA